ncbi:MAG: hypothetical protein HND52_13470 [Ignavibacteriae bacterium]|nr:hypothetical protein [Ignavibacteriota bacterium]NOG98963.1 hypothetical protein [Ignavibacteriota bacterium]
MLKELLEKIQTLSRTQTPFDVSRFNDPVAEKTLWTPAKGGGANFKTHNLVKVDYSRIEFRSSVGAKLFYLIFLLVGLGVMIGVSVSKISDGTFGFNWETFLMLTFGSIFAGVGGGLLYYGSAPVVFDKKAGYFWKGRKSPREVFNKSSIKHLAKLEDVHAIQLISEFVWGNKSSYHSYEINLVLKDASRINVIDHGNIKSIRENAETLSAFLDKPVWYAV